MITIEKTFPGTIAYPLERLGDPEKLVFFDIETTGFSADYKRRRDEATSKALDEMRSIADEDGAYDIDYSDYLSGSISRVPL